MIRWCELLWFVFVPHSTVDISFSSNSKPIHTHFCYLQLPPPAKVSQWVNVLSCERLVYLFPLVLVTFFRRNSALVWGKIWRDKCTSSHFSHLVALITFSDLPFKFRTLPDWLAGRVVVVVVLVVEHCQQFRLTLRTLFYFVTSSPVTRLNKQNKQPFCSTDECWTFFSSSSSFVKNKEESDEVRWQLEAEICHLLLCLVYYWNWEVLKRQKKK